MSVYWGCRLCRHHSRETTVQDGLAQALNVVGGHPVREGQHSGHMLRNRHLIHLWPQCATQAPVLSSCML